MHAYGFSRESLTSFSLFLKRCKQSVKIKSTHSVFQVLPSGVPPGFSPNFFFHPMFPAFLWLKFSDFNQKWITGFTHISQRSHINSRSLKEIQVENLHNFKDILLMKWNLHLPLKYVSVTTPTYDARWMCFNFTHILMNIVENIDLHNSLETFLIRIVRHLKTVKDILVLYTTQGKKCSAFSKETLKRRTMQYRTKTQTQECIVHQSPLNTHFLQYSKQFI